MRWSSACSACWSRLALLLWLPNLVWQQAHGWPVLDFSADIADEYGGVAGRVDLVTEALLMFSPLIAVVWVVGLVQLFRRPAWAKARPVAFAFVTVLVVFLVSGGKGYYLAGLIPPLVAAGCVVLVERWSARRAAVAGVVLALSAIVAWPAVVPVLPADTYAASPFPDINEDQLETIGWPQYAAQVRAVVDDLSPEQRRTAVVFTQNYGEAGALQWYDVGLPVYSGHNGWRAWGPPADDALPVVVVSTGSPTGFEGCEQRATLHNDEGADNEESGAGVWICAGPRGSWSEAWDDLVHYDA